LAVPAVSAGQIESWQGADDVASGPPNGEADLWPPLPDFLNRNRPALGPVGDTLDDFTA
jgi:hypothetical protein